MPPPLRSPAISFSTYSYTNQVCRAAQSRPFSTTQPQHRRKTFPRVSQARSQLFRWLRTTGVVFRDAPAAGHTNYLNAYSRTGAMKRRAVGSKKSKHSEEGKEDDREGFDEQDVKDNEIPRETRRDLQPFPNNNEFVSQSVLSDVFRDEIWKAIMEQGKLVRDVSAELGVDMARVGAVVRLKEIEKEWKRIGKPLAIPYHNALMGMLPITEHKSEIIKKDEDDNEKGREYIQPHESINDLIMHPATFPQIFHPTSESRVFTRADAAKVFDDHLLPADDRVPHPELALMHKDLKAMFKQSEIMDRQAARDRQADEMRQYYLERKAKRQPVVKEVHGRRWEFKFTEVNSDNIGKDGRGHKGVGWRYGMPFMDRSRGHVKIPTKVD